MMKVKSCDGDPQAVDDSPVKFDNFIFYAGRHTYLI